MKDPVAVTELESLHGHQHPTLDVGRLEHEVLVLDDRLEVRVQEL